MKKVMCEVCKRAFKTYRKNQRFCSLACFGKSDSVGIFKKGCQINLGRNRPDTIERNKRFIGKIPWNKGKRGIYSKESLIKMSEKHKGRFVSEETRRKLSVIHKGKKLSTEIRRKLSISHKGEKGSNWRGGITPLIKQIRKSFEYVMWRMQIFQRDNFTCVLCDKRGGWNKKLKKRIVLHADHIKAFSKIFHENNINTFEDALNCQDFWDTNNGRTLCRDCHKGTENYGRNL